MVPISHITLVYTEKRSWRVLSALIEPHWISLDIIEPINLINLINLINYII